MKAWLFLLGGLIIWAGHFLAAYALASVAEIAHPDHRQPLMLLFAGLTIVGVVATIVLALRALRPGANTAGGVFARRLSAAGSAIAAVAIIWQSAPIYWSFS